MKKSSINIIGLALSAAFFLTSCAGGGTDEPVKDPEPTATLNENTDPEETPEPEEPVVEEPDEPEEPELTADDFENGETIELDEDQQLPKGVKAYSMPDGSSVVVKRDEPMPKEVADAVQDAVHDVVPLDKGSLSVNVLTVDEKAREAAASMRAKTGKEIVVVFSAIFSCTDADATLQWRHTPIHYLDNDMCADKAYPTKAAAMAGVEARIAKQDEPNAYEIVIRKN